MQAGGTQARERAEVQDEEEARSDQAQKNGERATHLRETPRAVEGWLCLMIKVSN